MKLKGPADEHEPWSGKVHGVRSPDLSPLSFCIYRLKEVNRRWFPVGARRHPNYHAWKLFADWKTRIKVRRVSGNQRKSCASWGELSYPYWFWGSSWRRFFFFFFLLVSDFSSSFLTINFYFFLFFLKSFSLFLIPLTPYFFPLLILLTSYFSLLISLTSYFFLLLLIITFDFSLIRVFPLNDAYVGSFQGAFSSPWFWASTSSLSPSPPHHPLCLLSIDFSFSLLSIPHFSFCLLS